MAEDKSTGKEPDNSIDKKTPLEQEAYEALNQLKKTGTEVPEAIQAAVNEFRKAREEAASYRVQSKDYDSVKKTLSKIKEERDQYYSQYESLKSQLDNQKKESKVSKVASSLGMDADLTIAHLHRKGKFSDIDDETDLNKLLESELKEKPNLKVNGAVNTGDTGEENTTSTKSDFNKWIRGKLQ